jgi:two-component system, chemotaxis family, response regulator Rcp1
MHPSEILLVEDNAADVRLTQEVLRKSAVSCNLTVARDGEQAMRMLRRQGEHKNLPLPDLILLDLNLPLKDGRQVLAELKQDSTLRSIPVVVLTTSRADNDVSTCYDLHANSYLVKPVDLAEFEQVIEDIQRYWFGRVQLPRHS